ncbi:MAG: 30S ribosome-binding factor RbfA [Desulfobacterota bacterium]|jgi:ribosome-binding factor A|nr:30S ribosome-binding factor RbfA [Thermodesulfobacteriota bacterium]
MLPGRRASRVGDLILREIADLLMTRVKDPRVKKTTVTGIVVSQDLRYAKVFYSLIGSEQEILDAQKGLESATGFIKREIGLRMDLKYIPDIVFKHDPSLAEGDHMEKLFRKLKTEASSGSEI